MILAKTIKGYGLGEGGEGRNMTHNQKKLNEEELREFRTRFGIPISDERGGRGAVLPAAGRQPGDEVPARAPRSARRLDAVAADQAASTMEVPRLADYDKTMAKLVSKGTGKEMSTTMGFVRLLSDLLRDKKIGKHIVPIVPDESRTFGMEGLFRQVGIYSHVGPALRAGRFRSDRVLQGSEGRPDARRRHHRSRLDVVVHRRRHGLLVARREHDPDVHLLLDVRLPADRRPDLGRRRLRAPRASCSAARPAARRSTAKACSIRTATACSTRSRSRPCGPTTRPTPTRRP